MDYRNKILATLPSGVSVLDLNGRISSKHIDQTHVIGGQFAKQLRNQFALGQKTVVYINSDGGEVDEGWSIVQAIKDTDSNTHVVGRAGSMSGMALLFGKHRTANEFARIHLHGASTRDGKQNEATEVINTQFRSIMEQTTTLSDKQINAILATNGKRSMMFTAQEALKFGLIDEIIDAKSSLVVAEMEEQELYVAYAELNNVKPKSENSMKNVNIFLGLNADASEDSAVKAIETIKADATASTEKVTSLQAKVTELEAENAVLKKANETAQKASITALLDQAEASKKITADSRDSWEAQLVANFDATKGLLDSIPGSKAEASSASKDLKESKKKEKVTDFTPEACAEIITSGTFEAYSEEEQDQILEGYDEHNKSQTQK